MILLGRVSKTDYCYYFRRLFYHVVETDLMAKEIITRMIAQRLPGNVNFFAMNRLIKKTFKYPSQQVISTLSHSNCKMFHSVQIRMPCRSYRSFALTRTWASSWNKYSPACVSVSKLQMPIAWLISLVWISLPLTGIW